MVQNSLLVTGSNGLIGSEVVAYFANLEWQIHGVDNNMRAQFFGPAGDTRWNQIRLCSTFNNFTHHEIDVRDRAKIRALLAEVRPTSIVHCAAQPSHDLAASQVLQDFDINAASTINLLEVARLYCPESPFVFMSTNKVYGDAPNEIALEEQETRWDYREPIYRSGIPESFRIDRSKHSIFGAAKLAADIMVQEYGRYFGMPTCCLRGGCLTGPNHAGVELHGFLNYLVRCNVERRIYKIYGYKGKQVRDNLHSFDVARFIEQFIEAPRCGEVYNLGGGRTNSISIREAFVEIEKISGCPMGYEYSDEPRSGDHICYISDLTKMRTHYPHWNVTRDLGAILREIHDAMLRRPPGDLPLPR
jgi:CDP-paratose 2-epimerase